MKKIIFAIIAVGVLAIGAIFVIAQRGMHSGFAAGWGGGKGAGLFLRGLDLTADQKAKVKEIMDAAKTKNEPIRESLKADHEKLEEVTANGAFDEKQVTDIANEQATSMAQMIVERARVKSQIFAILTDEQKAKAAQMKERVTERFKNRMKDHNDGERAPGGSEF